MSYVKKIIDDRFVYYLNNPELDKKDISVTTRLKWEGLVNNAYPYLQDRSNELLSQLREIYPHEKFN